MNKKNYIAFAKKSAKIQIDELKKINKVFNNSFAEAINLIINTKGKIIFSGVGKNSFICKKSAATFSSVGIPSFFVDPTGASHGDMGQIEKKDILIIISNSGNTAELSNILKFANRFRIKIIGISSNSKSMLSNASDINIIIPKLRESDPIILCQLLLHLLSCCYVIVWLLRLWLKENLRKINLDYIIKVAS